MKRILFLFMAAMMLGACGNDAAPKEETPKIEPVAVEKESIEVTMNVEPVIQEDGKVYFLGKTNLPDHAELMFTVTGDDFMGQIKEVIIDGAFETESFSEKGEALPAGEYELSVTLSIPSTQDKKFTEVAGKDYEFLTGNLMDDDGIGKSMEYEFTFAIEQSKAKETVKVDEKERNMTNEELMEILDYNALGENDELVSVSIEGDEIKAVIKLAPHDILPAENVAGVSYSQASDELLTFGYWKVLTIEYVDVGTISMNRSEKETNEYDMDYFPTAEIEKRLK
ncbi:hypothetical protein [Sporosarcina limicola]|uniref:Uncharacterized protein n=1 Tax=Sporosarcina limicola TaxID=34101 RepID=A0A927RCW4_9BACL|nr:hypothetical protein [Sporosarcina limicola]MBE1554790.1 hypothetical protein [Sporosarcina limicola]